MRRWRFSPASDWAGRRGWRSDPKAAAVLLDRIRDTDPADVACSSHHLGAAHGSRSYLTRATSHEPITTATSITYTTGTAEYLKSTSYATGNWCHWRAAGRANLLLGVPGVPDHTGATRHLKTHLRSGYCIRGALAYTSARVAGCGAARDAQKWLSGPRWRCDYLDEDKQSAGSFRSSAPLAERYSVSRKEFPGFLRRSPFSGWRRRLFPLQPIWPVPGPLHRAQPHSPATRSTAALPCSTRWLACARSIRTCAA